MRSKFNPWMIVLIVQYLLFWSAPGYPDEPMGEPLGKQIKINATPFVFNKKTGTYSTKLTLINRTKHPKQTFIGPLGLVIAGTNNPDVTLANAQGHTSAGLAYLSIPVPSTGLKPGKRIKGIILQFNNPAHKKFKPAYAVYSGLASSANFGTNSGAVGVLALNNARIAFVPVGQSINPVLLEGSNGVAISSSARSLPAAPTAQASAASSGASLTFSADACTVDSAALKVVCVGFNSTRIAILDVSVFINTLKVSDIKVAEIESGAPNVALSFSGGSCVLCGVAADPGDNRFIVAANDGYRVYSYGSSVASAVFPIPVNENFSFDLVRNRIIAAEYDISSSTSTRALNIVDLAKNQVYRWTKDTSSCIDLGASDSSCSASSSEVDSTAVDLATGMVALIFEHTTAVAMIDLGQSVFDDATLSFTAPSFYTESSAGPSQSGGAASTTGNFLFTSEELGDSHVGVMQMPAASGAGGVFPAVPPTPVFIELSSTPNPECAGGGSASYGFSTKGDPHGLALYTGLVGGKQTGLVIDDSNTCAALVDLAGLFGAPHDTTDSTQAASTVDLRATGIVRFVKLQ